MDNRQMPLNDWVLRSNQNLFLEYKPTFRQHVRQNHIIRLCYAMYRLHMQLLKFLHIKFSFNITSTSQCNVHAGKSNFIYWVKSILQKNMYIVSYFCSIHRLFGTRLNCLVEALLTGSHYLCLKQRFEKCNQLSFNKCQLYSHKVLYHLIQVSSPYE